MYVYLPTCLTQIGDNVDVKTGGAAQGPQAEAGVLKLVVKSARGIPTCGFAKLDTFIEVAPFQREPAQTDLKNKKSKGSNPKYNDYFEWQGIAVFQDIKCTLYDKNFTSKKFLAEWSFNISDIYEEQGLEPGTSLMEFDKEFILTELNTTVRFTVSFEFSPLEESQRIASEVRAKLETYMKNQAADDNSIFKLGGIVKTQAPSVLGK